MEVRIVDTIIEDIEVSTVVGKDEGFDVIPVVVMVISEVVGIVVIVGLMVGVIMLKEEEV